MGAEGKVRNAIEQLSAVIAPLTLLTALGLYIGWRRTDSYARYFGIDQSLLQYSPQDYLLRSWQSAHQVVFTIVLGAIVLIVLHMVIVRIQRQRYLWAVIAVCGGASGLVLAIMTLSFFVPPLARWISGYIYDVPYLTNYSIAAFSSALLLYAAALMLRAMRKRAASLSVTSVRVSVFLVVVLLFLGTLSATDKWVSILGEKDAEYMATTLQDRQEVIVYSKENLNLADPVMCRELSGSHQAYRFRCEGLRLYIRAADKFFLLPTTWSRADISTEADRMIVLRDDQSLRFEFTPPRRR